MLAKQAWRILQEHNSLVAQILKSLYFPRKDFMDATLGSNPSYMWRSICEGSELSKLGVRWKVGDRERICVWKNPWIPQPIKFKPVSNEMKVKELMLGDSGSWNVEVLGCIFCPRDVELIKENLYVH